MVTAINDDPFNQGTIPTEFGVVEDLASGIDLSSLELADVDAGSSPMTLTLSTQTGGQLSAASGAGVTVSGNAIALHDGSSIPYGNLMKHEIHIQSVALCFNKLGTLKRRKYRNKNCVNKLVTNFASIQSE